MVFLFPSATPERPLPTFNYTIRNIVCIHGQRIEQTQFASEKFIVTIMGGSTLLFSTDLQGRFIVDRGKRLLHPLDPTVHRQQVEKIRTMLGSVEMEVESANVEIDGRSCRCIRLSNHQAELVLSLELYCARIDGLDRTAIGAERAFDAPHQPFAVPLDKDEIVVRSTTRVLSAEFSQNQTMNLTGIESGIADIEQMDRYLDFSIAPR